MTAVSTAVFEQITSDDAAEIVRHYHAIAKIAGYSLTVWVRGSAEAKDGEPIFIQNTFVQLVKPPSRELFKVEVDQEETLVLFPWGLDLKVTLKASPIR